MEVDVELENMQASGPVMTVARPSWAERALCNRCGSELRDKATGPGGETPAVRAPLFDGAGGPAPAHEIRIDRKPGGYAVAGDQTRKSSQEVEAMSASFGKGELQ